MRSAIVGALGLLLMARAGAAPAAAAPATPGPGNDRTLVVCAPGYPGTTSAAQPTMDRFAGSVAAAAGWPPDRLRAVYFETAEGGLGRLREPDAALALVPLRFFLQHRADLDLAPVLQIVQESGASEVWSLVAKKGAAASPAALAGWEITGLPGDAPDFVRGAILGGWGPLPEGARITYAPTVLSALRRAASGERLAVLLDGAQADAISSLPFAGDLEVVARSRPLPAMLLCVVGRRLPAAESRRLVAALQRLHERPEGAEVLKSVRIVRFQPVDRASIEAAGRSSRPTRADRP